MSNFKTIKEIAKTYIFLIVFIIISIYTSVFPIPLVQSLDRYFSEILLYSNTVTQDKEKLAVILVGDKTVDALERWPLDRAYYADLLNNHMGGAKAVVFDFLFPDKYIQEGDMAFAAAMARNGRVVLSYIDNYDGQPLTYPFDLFLNTAHSLGYVNYIKDEDGFTRNYNLLEEFDGILRKSLLFSTLDVAGYELNMFDGGFFLVETDSGKVVSTFDSEYSDFFVASASEENIKIYELIDVLDNQYPQNEFDNAITFLGGSFAGASDTINMPDRPIIGVHFLLNAMNTLLANVQPTSLSVFFQSFLKILNVLILFFAVRKLKLKWSAFVSIGLLVLNSLLFTYLTKTFWITFDIAHFILLIMTAYIVSLIDKILFGDKKLKKMEASLDKILNLNMDTVEITNFVDYIKSIEENILRQSHFSVVEYLVGHSHPIVQKYYNSEPSLNIRILDNRVLIPLGSFNKKNEMEFIVLGYKGKINGSELKYIASLFVTVYTFFQYRSEYAKKNALFLNLFESMVSAVDAKSPITGFHSKKVADFSVRIGTLLGYDDQALEQLYFAGIVHDIGKIAVPDNVLDKPCFFSANDRAIMESHPAKGAEMANLLDLGDDIKTAIMQHHERIDGKGYPLGLKGDEISEVARIIKIADVYDALTSERQYKKVWPIKRVCDLFYEGLGTVFDERITLLVLEDIKPADWVPPVKRIKQKEGVSDSNKNAIFALLSRSRDLYAHQIKDYMHYVESLNQKSHKDDCYQFADPLHVDFKFDTTFSFGGIHFGEHVSKEEWLDSFPSCILIENYPKRRYYYKHNDGLVKGFLYVFLRGYLNVCALNSGTGDLKSAFVEEFKIYGEPVLVEDHVQIWDAGDTYICLQDAAEFECAIALYLNKYFLGE